MQSEQIGDLAKALATAQGAIKGAVKGKENPFFRSQYADLPAIMDACRDALSKNSIAVIQTTDFDIDHNSIWVETTLLHSSGQWIKGRYPVRPTKDDPQGLGSAITYARRYSLAAMVGVVAENEDDDGNAGSVAVPAKDISKDRTPPKTDKPKPTDETAKNAAIKFAQDAGKDLKSIVLKEQLSAWLSINKPKVDRLKDYDKDLFDMVSSDIIEATTRVT